MSSDCKHTNKFDTNDISRQNNLFQTYDIHAVWKMPCRRDFSIRTDTLPLPDMHPNGFLSFYASAGKEQKRIL